MERTAVVSWRTELVSSKRLSANALSTLFSSQGVKKAYLLAGSCLRRPFALVTGSY